MARIIETHLDPVLNVAINTIYANGNVSSSVFTKGDVIEGLRYAENGDIKTITGKLCKVNYTTKTVKRNYSSNETVKSYFAEDVTPVSISVDCSKEYESNIVTVPVKEILEFTAKGDEVARMMVSFNYGVHCVVELSDETSNEFTIREGSVYESLTYLDLEAGKDVTTAAKVVAISYETGLAPKDVIFVANGVVKKLDVNLIKNAVGEVAPCVTDAAAVNAMINAGASVINLGKGEVVAPIVVTGDVTILGAYPDIPVNSKAYKGKTTDTVISGGIEVAEGASLTLRGVTLTKDSRIEAKTGSVVTLENCIVKDIAPYQAKSYLVLPKGDTPLKLVVKGCFFGNNAKTDAGKFYNCFELAQRLADGTEISDNYFEEEVCSNNAICIYDAEDNARISICNNVFEYSGNAIRVGTKGDVKCEIIIKNNTYMKTDSNAEYAGLLLVQPYGAATTNMSNVKISLIGNKHNDKLQLYYLYSAGKDMPFTEENKPVITVS